MNWNGIGAFLTQLFWIMVLFLCAPDHVRASDTFSESVKGLSAVVPSREFQLKNGDTFVITAAPAKQKVDGKWIRRLAYNGMIPGPLLRVTQGSRIKVILKNATEIDTTLHPHGLKVLPQYDGIPGIGQPPIKNGGSYEYVLNFPDHGMFWYHPHIRDDYAQDAGLYGAIIVTPGETGIWTSAREVPLILDDLDLSKRGSTYFKSQTTHTLMGRFGTRILVNGETSPQINATQNERIRFLVLNAANTRTFRFSIPGADLSLIGADNGNLQRPESIESVTLGPGERYIIEGTFKKPGEYYLLNSKPKHPDKIAMLQIEAGKGVSQKDEKEVPFKATISSAQEQAIRAKGSATADFTLRLSVEMNHQQLPMEHMEHSDKSNEASKNPTSDPTFYFRGRTTGVEWDNEMASVNAKSTDKNVVWKMIDETDKKSNMSIHWRLIKNQLYHVRIINDAHSMHPMQHPIHFHGQNFAITAVNGIENSNLAWRDTALLGSGDTVDIVLEASNPGEWMAHCHIAEHLGAGMMMGFAVVEK